MVVRVKLMNIKLRILSLWFPEFMQIKELEKTSELTNDCLDKLLKKHSISPPEKVHGKGSIDERRVNMAVGHNKRVNALVDVLGHGEALKLGKEQMFKVGCIMGSEARERLGVGEKIEDTIAAARILYKILGIDFTVETHENDLILIVHSCELAKNYSPETCAIMSAADKGVLKGLNGKLDLEFKKRITEGAKECTACINVVVGEKK